MRADLAARAALRGGVFTRGDALACGYTPDQIRARLHNKRWVRLRRGIFSVAPVPPGDPRVAAAALAALPGTAALSHATASGIHRLASVSAPSSEVHVTVPGAPARRSDGLHVHGRPLPPGSVLVQDGVRLTTKSRTVLDLSRTLPFGAAVVAVDEFMRLHPEGVVELEQLAEMEVGPLSARARHAVAFGDGLSESPGESLSRVAMVGHGLPAPRLQVWVGDADGVIGRVDFLWDRWRTVGEFDGRSKYRSVQDLWAEKRREDRLREAGFEVVRWAWADVVGEFGPVASRLRRAFARAARLSAAA